MSEFLLIHGAAQHQCHDGASDEPRRILRRMAACLHDLDRIEARLAAAYLDTAIQHLRSQFDLEEDTSGSD